MPKLWLSGKNLLQVNAFKSVFKQNLRLGFTIDFAFAGAIEATSDKIFKRANPKLVKEYLENYGKQRTTVIHRVDNASC